MKRLITLALTALLSTPSIASDGSGYFFSVGLLAGSCSSTKEFDVGLCRGFVVGVVDAGNGVHYCLPEDKKAGFFIEPIVKAIVQANTDEQRALPANEVIILALANTFPCKREERLTHEQRNPRSGGWV